MTRIITTLILLLVLSGSSAQQNQSAPCSTPEHRQFDFWIGDWNVQDFGSGTPVGKNRIVRIHACTLEENWEGNAGDTGTSLNNYRPDEQKWHQVWVNSNGAFLHLIGEFRDGKMVLSGEGIRPLRGVRVLNRVTWSLVNNNPNRVRQFWEVSQDDGKTWSVDFDGLYVRRQP